MISSNSTHNTGVRLGIQNLEQAADSLKPILSDFYAGFKNEELLSGLVSVEIPEIFFSFER